MGTDDKPDDKPDTKPDDSKPDDKPDDSKPDTGDVDKWKGLSRKHETDLRKAQKELDELKNAGKSETEKLTDRVAQAEKSLAAAEARALQLEVAGEKGLTSAQAKRLVGTTREELEADADELLETFGGKPSDGDKPKPGGRPKEDLKGGSGTQSDEPEEKDPRKLAAAIPRRGGV